MRKIILSLMCCIAVMVSCDLETSNNGNLDGFWQLRQIDSLDNGASVDMREESVTWSFQYNLAQMRKTGYISAYFRFSHSADSLVLSEPCQDAREQSDPAITDVALIQPLGINNLEEHYKVLSLDGSSMTLQSQTLRLHFRRY